MSRREIDRLLWELVDGSLAPEDRERLEARLAAEPEDRARLDEMRALAQILDSVEELPLPESLPAAVGRVIAGEQPPARSSRAWWPGLGELFAPRWRVRLAWAVAGLAFGVGLGILAVADLGRSSVDDVSRFYGAMTRDWDRTVAGLRLTLADGSGAVTLNREGAVVLIELTVDRPQAAPVVLEIAGEGLVIRGVRTDAEAAVEAAGVGDRIALTPGPAGRSLLRVATPDQEAVLVVRVTAGDRRLLERELRVGELPAS